MKKIVMIEKKIAIIEKDCNDWKKDCNDWKRLWSLKKIVTIEKDWLKKFMLVIRWILVVI